jgi:hypothetical protein
MTTKIISAHAVTSRVWLGDTRVSAVVIAV